ncbi:MAG: pyruvate:ferredoxin (flavodoxin) oxidoreductase [Planctomycetota bacterium]|nr:MAG: pyruvate:ferredoxin (flavodoxin) oxidoreductase [Planctomycetota bacterium]
MQRRFVTLDGNEAVASVAHRINEVIAIYPITPASPMGEFADMWAAGGKENIFGTVPDVVEMQSEAGAAGTLHGSLQTGALTTTFTASQGLLLMLPNMFKVAGELTPTVIHVAARSLATHALSIFGDHSDVMSARTTGFAMLCSASVQECHDLALLSQAASLQSRIPFLHFFDGFRTSHEVNKIEELTDEDLHFFMEPELIQAHRDRALNPERPVLRGTAQNPDVFFQAREASNPYYDGLAEILEQSFDRFADRVGRRYRLFEYFGAEDAERVVVVMGSGAATVKQTVSALNAAGEKVGMVQVRLFRPFSAERFLKAMPASVRSIAVLDRTKEPGALGEPLFQDVITAAAESWQTLHGSSCPKVVGGRYGLSSKEFTPAMVASVFAELERQEAKPRFTVGIVDDVSGLSLKWDPDFNTEPDDVTRAVFFGLGSDGTVGANKNSVKIIGEGTSMHAQGYFVYDSKKSGSTTVSHLRFGPQPVDSPYLISRANFVACHQFNFLERMDVLETAEPGATFLLNSPFGKEEVWQHVPEETQRQIVDKKLKFYVVDAAAVAKKAGMGGRINTVMQTCFFSLSNILPKEEALQRIKDAIKKTYGRRGESILQRNYAAVDGAVEALHLVKYPEVADNALRRLPPVPAGVPDFVEKVTSLMLAGKGDLLPVSALPVDGTFPTTTARYERRSIAREIPIWDPEICIQCGLCAFVCPHAAIRTKAFALESLQGCPEHFLSRDYTEKKWQGSRFTVQVAPDDCTGCGVCVDVCPARSKEVARHKAINMEPKEPHLEQERQRFDFFLQIPEADRSQVDRTSIKGSQLLEPLFEYSGACSGCGETPYVKLMSQLFGDRAVIANATGCSSIYGGNLPTTPWATDADGCGPAWSNSLFEDNAEFGLGMRLAIDQQHAYAVKLLTQLAAEFGDECVAALTAPCGPSEAEIRQRRQQVRQLKDRLRSMPQAAAKDLLAVADHLIPRSVWILGGDGWAYDIGFGGVDHVLASGRNVNILVLDTGVYSNTGGQASKATPRAAVAKFAADGKAVSKKDLGMIAAAYGNVYVAQIAMGANPKQCLNAMLEAESYPGPSLILAYSHCIAHGVNMTTAMTHQKLASKTGFWPLFRYDPRRAHDGGHPFHLDSRKPKLPFQEFASKEGRFAMLARANPQQAQHLLALAQKDIDDRWHYYEQLAGIERENADLAEELKV